MSNGSGGHGSALTNPDKVAFVSPLAALWTRLVMAFVAPTMGIPKNRVTFSFNPDIVALVIKGFTRGPGSQLLNIPRLRMDIPDDAVVERVYACPDPETIRVVISHPSFPEVEDGAQPRVVPFGSDVVSMDFYKKVDEDQRTEKKRWYPSGWDTKTAWPLVC